MRKEYNKLVRDRIPEIIRRDGRNCEIATISEDEYLQALREKLVEEAQEAAEADPPKPENMAILGSWGIGKTSLLKKFETMALENEEVFTARCELVPAFCNDFNAFSIRIRNEIERSFTVSNKDLLAKLKREIIPDWRIKTFTLGIGTLEQTHNEKSAVTAFEDSLSELWNILKQNKIKLMLLMIDDLQYLAKEYPNGLYDLRGIFQKLAMDGCNIMLIIAGPETLFEIKDFAEPFARFFDRYKLKLFNLEETKKAILKPLKLSNSKLRIEDSVIQKIYEKTQGHPYFIHLIMHDLFRYKDGAGLVDDKFFKEKYQKIIDHLSKDKFDYDFLTKASEKEREILLKIAKLNDHVFSPSDIEVSGIRAYIGSLSEKELLVKLERGSYKLYHPLFREYLANRTRLHE